MVIRQTWGNPKFFPDTSIRLVFVCGQNSDNSPSAQAALEFEAEQYGDIVQEDFHDSYKNLTYKGIAALKWISLYCRHAKFVLKTDDDIFVNMFTLLRHLNSMDHYGVQNRNLLMCLVWYHMTVMRTGKWAISKDDWPEDSYPTYCSGSAFVMTTDVAVALHNVSYQVCPPFTLIR
jgi:beta-1,3-galactosyltransferase 1